jgi:O-antigen/teichoic acid export membrane protein
VEDLFAVIFGESWREAGIYAKILIPYFAVNFIVSALSVTDSVMEKQYYYAAFNFLMLVSVACIFLFDFESFISFLVLITLIFVLMYLLYLYISWMVASAKI